MVKMPSQRRTQKRKTGGRKDWRKRLGKRNKSDSMRSIAGRHGEGDLDFTPGRAP